MDKINLNVAGFAAGFLQNQIPNSWDNGSAMFAGLSCKYSTRPQIKNFEFTYYSKFWCPGLAPISGRGTSTNKNKSLDIATEEFAKKALSRGLISKEDAKQWLK